VENKRTRGDYDWLRRAKRCCLGVQCDLPSADSGNPGRIRTLGLLQATLDRWSMCCSYSELRKCISRHTPHTPGMLVVDSDSENAKSGGKWLVSGQDMNVPRLVAV